VRASSRSLPSSREFERMRHATQRRYMIPRCYRDSFLFFNALSGVDPRLYNGCV
jgi:hypothetical protein